MDDANFKFQIYNELGSAEANIKVNILGILLNHFFCFILDQFFFIILLFLLVAPEFIKNLESAKAVLKNDFIWNFELKSKPQADIKIFKDNKEIKLNDRINIKKIVESDNNYVLEFKNVEPSDAGIYKLLASNKIGSANSQSELTVTGAPFFVRKPNSVLSVPEKKSLKAEYEVNGIPVPEISW